ncbi:hypothetical protein ACLQ2P_30845 [Actinomadura citrea]
MTSEEGHLVQDAELGEEGDQFVSVDGELLAVPSNAAQKPVSR